MSTSTPTLCEQYEADDAEFDAAMEAEPDTCAECGSNDVQIFHWDGPFGTRVIGVTCSRDCADAFNAKQEAKA